MNTTTKSTTVPITIKGARYYVQRFANDCWWNVQTEAFYSWDDAIHAARSIAETDTRPKVRILQENIISIVAYEL